MSQLAAFCTVDSIQSLSSKKMGNNVWSSGDSSHIYHCHYSGDRLELFNDITHSWAQAMQHGCLYRMPLHITFSLHSEVLAALLTYLELPGQFLHILVKAV